MSRFVLGTDIATLYQLGQEVVCRTILGHDPAEMAITVISVEEQLSGWYALLRKATKPADLANV